MAVAVAALALAACVDPAEDRGVTVSGTVVSLEGGPIVGAQVWIGDRPVVTSGVDGAFEVAGVRTPYDAVVVADGSGQPYVSIYQGLSERIPVLTVEAPAAVSTATVAGTLDGFAYQPADVTVGAACGAYPWSHAIEVAPDGTYAASLGWDTGGSGAATLQVLQYARDADGLPSMYRGKWGYGTLDLVDGAVLDGVPLASMSVVGVRVTATYTGVPAGYAVVRAVPTHGEGRCMLALPAIEAPTPEFTYVAPHSGAADFKLAIVAEDAAGALVVGHLQYALHRDQTALGLQLPPGVTLLSPAAGGALASSTTLEASWARVGSVLVHRLVSAPGAPAIRVVTSADRAPLAGLARAGVTLPSGASYAWTVETYDLTADTLVLWRGIGRWDDPTAPLHFGMSARSAPRTLVVP